MDGLTITDKRERIMGIADLLALVSWLIAGS
jgi:hypothetical protein